ncbi:sialate O-acetylesterase [Alkalicoccobacillus plakortidis]|uniref:Sialate O-acetylesterase n=1 Tax=Alkalicoccobacillus plakortidis TaxID=444060 RepID=A0ABT0XJ28_9BACI|nr:sialate O-acetylesterase [Alkalicoccobacillus plakortidis]MCM2675904.1 sialate O-acetylesterase [Alkalicoccobacillus plakortidis]
MKVDLVLFMGQSNIAGRGVAEEAPSVAEGHGYEFRAITDPTTLYPVTEPFGVNENKEDGITETIKTGSLVSAFINEYYSITHLPIVAVSASKGGSSIDEWQPGTPYLNDSIDRLHTAKEWLESNGYEVRRLFMVWCQGETDALVPKSSYVPKLTNMIEEMLEQGVERCYLIRIGNKEGTDLYKSMIEIQTDFCKSYPHATLVSTLYAGMTSDQLNLMKDDGIHYTQEGYNRVGEEAGRNVAFHINNRKEPCMYDPEYGELYFSYKS